VKACHPIVITVDFYQTGPVLSRASTNVVQSQHVSPKCTLATLKTKDKLAKCVQNILQNPPRLADVPYNNNA